MLRVFTSRRCLAHTAPGGYPERPERLTAIVDHLRRGAASGAFAGALVEEADAAEIAAIALGAIRAVHDERYVRRLQKAVARGDGLIDSADNPISAGTWDAAMAAVEVTLTAADWVAAGGHPAGGGEGAERHAFAAIRPPGHHAERDRAMGFCFFGNVAVAAEHWIASGAARRVAIVDFDLHHGNGTQHLFEERPDVLYVSLHQAPLYPGTGAAAERGRGEGEGATLNVPLPRGTGDAEYLAAMDAEVLPALDAFAPDLLAVSAGFDTWREDPLGGLLLSEDAFREIGRRMRAVARRHCAGRSLTVLEGGYDVAALPRLVEAYLEGLAGAPGAPAAGAAGAID